MRRLIVLTQQAAPLGRDGFLSCSPTSASEEYKPQSVLFTGGCGFIGSNTLIHLVKKYPAVRWVCFDNLSEGSNQANLRPVQNAQNLVIVLGNITSESTVRSVMTKYNIDTVMHLAAQTHVDRGFVFQTKFAETNTVGTAVLLQVSKDLGVKRFVHISTDEVYGENRKDWKDGAPFDESAPMHPGNPYSASKAGAECLVMSYWQSYHKALPVIVVRPNNIYGPRQHPEKLIPKFIVRLSRKQQLTIHGAGTQRRCYLYVQDAAEAFDIVLHKGVSGQAYNIGAQASSNVSVKDVSFALLKAFGIDRDKAWGHIDTVADRPHNDTSYDVESLKIRALGWSPKIDFQTGLKGTVDWYLRNPTHWGDIEQALQPHNGGGGTASTAAADGRNTTGGKVWYAPNMFQAYGNEEIEEVTQCLKDGWLAPGPRTEEFERKVSELFGKKFGVMVNSGSSANMVGIAALGMHPGDEVITPACTFSTVVAPLEMLQLKPVFVDVEPGRYVPTVDAVIAAITPRTKCVMLPNLIGSKPDWAELRRRVPKGIWLFEDSCDTITHTTESDLSAISFYASHIITAGGLGGMIMFNDEELKKKALMFRDWGRVGNNSEEMSERFGHSVDGIEYDFKFLYEVQGFNMKACEMNAAFGLAQLRKLDEFKGIRRRNVNRYVETLLAAKTRYTVPAMHDQMDWLALPLMHPDRKGVLRFLENNDVQIRVCFAGNITRHPAFRHHLQNFSGSDRIMADAFLIGAHHGLTIADVDRVCELLIRYDRHGAGAISPTPTPAAKSEKERDSVSLDL